MRKEGINTLKSTKLRTKLITAFLLVGLLPLLLVCLFSYFSFQEELVAEAFTKLHMFTGEKRNDVEIWLNSIMSASSVIAATSDVHQSLHILRGGEYQGMTIGEAGNRNDPLWLARLDILQDSMARYRDAFGIAVVNVIDEHGTIVYSTEGFLSGAKRMQQDYVQKGLQGMATTSEFFYSDVINEYCIVTAVPVYAEGGQGEVIGVFANILRAEDVAAIVIAGLDLLGETGDAFLVAADGLLLSRPRYGDLRPFESRIETAAVRHLAEPIRIRRLDFHFSGEYFDHRNGVVLGEAAVILLGDTVAGLITQIDSAEVRAAAVDLRTSMIIMIMIAAVAIALVAVKVSSSILKPIHTITGMVERVAEGDLSVDCKDTGRKDEIGILSTAFASLVSILRELVTGIVHYSSQLATVSEELSKSVDEVSKVTREIGHTISQVAHGSTKQGEELGGVNKYVEEMFKKTSALSDVVAKNREFTDTLQESLLKQEEILRKIEKTIQEKSQEEKKSLEEAEQGMGFLSAFRENINTLTKVTTEASKAVLILDDHSRETGKITDSIAAISEQSKLLALNAAIEAGRAGDAGKGFGVVADELRKLAEESDHTARLIAGLSERIRKDTREAVENMDRTGTQVSEVVQSSSKVGETFSSVERELVLAGQSREGLIETFAASRKTLAEIHKAREEAGIRTDEITLLVVEVENGFKTIIDNIGLLASVSGENVSGSEEISASTAKLSASLEQTTTAISSLVQMVRKVQNMTTCFRV